MASKHEHPTWRTARRYTISHGGNEMNNEITNEQLQEAMAWVEEKYKGDIPDNLYVHVLADKLGTKPSVVRDMLADMEEDDA